MITQETYAALLALQQERGIPTMSKTVGEALREWAEVRSGAGFKPRPGSDRTGTTSARPAGLKPTNARAVALQRWDEVRGNVREITEDGPRTRVALEDGGDVIAVVMPYAPQGIMIQVGTTVAIMRTDEPGREYVVRTLD